MNLAKTAEAAIDALRAATLTYTDEVSLHRAMGEVFDAAGIEYAREVVLGDAGRIDFLLAGGVGIEVKVAGSLAAVTRQMTRYSRRHEVRALVLVTTKASHGRIPTTLTAVPVGFYSLIGQAL